MGQYIIRRILTAIPTLLFISFIIFLLLDLAPGDPSANLPLSIPQEVRVRIRESLGLDEPMHIRYIKWMNQFFIVEPVAALEKVTGLQIGDSENRVRIVSWLSRGVPVIEVNPNPTDLAARAHVVLAGPSGQVLPALLDAMTRRS